MLQSVAEDASLAVSPIDNAIFSTGSNRAYVVSGTGEGDYDTFSTLKVSRDHVVFNHLNLNATGSYFVFVGGLLVEDGARVLFDSHPHRRG